MWNKQKFLNTMKTKLTIFFLLCTLSIFGQENCFENCKMNFENSESLSLDANGKFSLEKFNEIRNKIITGLIGCKIPDFNVKTINNKVLNTQDFRGKVIVLNFWFTACSPCIAEMPALNMLEKEYHDSDVVFIAFFN